MPSSSYSDIPEITAKFKSKVDKSITDSNTGQNMKILFLNNLIERNGQIFRPVFEGLRATFPRGITLEDNKWKGLCVFSREFPENMEILESEEHTQQKGWCAKSLVNMTFNEDIDCKTATSVADTLEICRTPEAASRNFKRKGDEPITADVIFEVSDNETLIVIPGQKKIGNKEFVQVKTKGTKGLLQQYHEAVAEVIYEKRDLLNLDRIETAEEAAKLIKFPIYWPKNKETGKYDNTRNPSMYAQCMYYKDRQTGEVNCADFIMAGTGTKLSPEDLANVSITGRPAFDESRWFITPSKITSQAKIVSFIVEKIEKIERPSIQAETLSSISIDQSQIDKNMEILRAARVGAASRENSPSTSGTGSGSGDGAGSKPRARNDDNQDDDLDAIMNAGSVAEDVEISPSGDSEFPEVPGLDD